MNKRAALKRAEMAGLKPVAAYRELKTLINEKVIYTVKKERLRHIDVADFSMIHRPRITRIMNRHLEKVSIDCMFQILDALGVHIEITFR
jgi:predicted XRE-type DNA-binding protein